MAYHGFYVITTDALNVNERLCELERNIQTFIKRTEIGSMVTKL